MRGFNLNDVSVIGVDIHGYPLTLDFTEDKIQIRRTYHISFYVIVTEISAILYVIVYKKVPLVFPK